jgi:hypothetical protein
VIEPAAASTTESVIVHTFSATATTVSIIASVGVGSVIAFDTEG